MDSAEKLRRARVIDEKCRLDGKTQALNAFIKHSTVFPTLCVEERRRMIRQWGHMKDYSQVLAERIEALEGGQEAPAVEEDCKKDL